MGTHAQDKWSTLALIANVLAADCACAPEVLLGDGTTISLAR